MVITLYIYSVHERMKEWMKKKLPFINLKTHMIIFFLDKVEGEKTEGLTFIVKVKNISFLILIKSLG